MTVPVAAPTSDAHGNTVYIDLDTVLLATHQGQRGVELGVQADLAEGIERLSQIADHIVVLAYPVPADSRGSVSAERRVEYVREQLGSALDGVIVVHCPHSDAACDCAKPGTGLLDVAARDHGVERHGGWYIGADQEGVVAGRTSGLHTIRIGPAGVDHLSAVHRPDYEARDLLDAANHIMIEELG
jgi:histidinol phosphatase-like enzyme